MNKTVATHYMVVTVLDHDEYLVLKYIESREDNSAYVVEIVNRPYYDCNCSDYIKSAEIIDYLFGLKYLSALDDAEFLTSSLYEGKLKTTYLGRHAINEYEGAKKDSMRATATLVAAIISCCVGIIAIVLQYI